MYNFCPHCGFETEEPISCQICDRNGCERCLEKNRLGWFCNTCRVSRIEESGPVSALRTQI